MPVYLTAIDRIPYTPSGKVDMKALPAPSMETGGYAPEDLKYISGTEEKLARIWCEVLEMERVPRTAGFFDLGGDSLRAVTLFLEIKQQFDVDLPLASLSQSPSIAALAEAVEQKKDRSAEPAEFRSLQLIQKGNSSSTPIFLIHGGEGNILVFNDFADSLGPQNH